MAKDPRLQQTIDVHLKRALIPELTDYLKKHTDQHFAMEKRFEPLMVCVFADKQPLWKIMNGVADVLGARWTDLKSEWRLVLPDPSKTLLNQYVTAETAVLTNDMFLRAKALADLVGKTAWAEQAPATGPQEMPDDISPEEWAKACVGNRAFYAAGLMFRDTDVLNLKQPDGRGLKSQKRDFPWGFSDFACPQAYTLGAPQNDDVAKSEMRGQTDQPGLDGTQVAVRLMPWEGTFESVAVSNSGVMAQRPKRLVARPLPTGELAKTKPGKWLLDWNSDLDKLDDPLLDRQIKLQLSPSPYQNGLYGIEDYLEALNKATGATVICDGFRVPIQPTNALDSDASVRQWLQQLKTTQSCFVRIDDATVMVRHGGFWDLRDEEPDEATVKAFENIKAPDLNDYADLAIALNAKWCDGEHYAPYVQCEQPLLTKFDFRPLRNSFLCLLAYGQFDSVGRRRLMAGEPYSGLYEKDNRFGTVTPFTVNGKDRLGRNVPVTGLSIGVQGSIRGEIRDTYIGFSAGNAVFLGCSVTSLEKLLMECFALPASYLDLSGRFPTGKDDLLHTICDGTTWASFGYRFSLMSQPFNPDDLANADKKVLYGSFRFLAGVTEDQGVYETVDIPSPASR